MVENTELRRVLTEESKEEKPVGQRIARFRKQRGCTQKELAVRIGVPHSLITDYERGKLRLHDKMVIRFAMALGISTDELLGLTGMSHIEAKPSLRIMRRLHKIETLPLSKQKALLQIIDGVLKSEGK